MNVQHAPSAGCVDVHCHSHGVDESGTGYIGYGVLSLWLGNNAYAGPEHVASIPIDGLRTWKIREGF